MAKIPKRTKSAGGIVVNREGLVLVVNQNGTSWSLPKGRLEPGETALEAAKREILEESGISHLELVADFGSYQRHLIGVDGGDDKSEMKKIFMYLFKTNQTDLNPSDPANPEARWVKREEVANVLTHRKDKKFFLSVIEKI
ncbi:MAG TPA: NUDIX domain-containing protein [candidate division Zixibacteria bacterium]|nr:NUDIX domain-containing protein [candidate division Zixibacteria bacterium]